jgi:hypothetical protein
MDKDGWGCCTSARLERLRRSRGQSLARGVAGEKRQGVSHGGIAVGGHSECVPSGSRGSFERLVHLLNEFEVFLRAREAGQFPKFGF